MQIASASGEEPKTKIMAQDRKRIPRLKPITAQPLCDQSARDIFKAYFNNKMTVILLLLQKRRVEPDSYSAMRAVIFFDDLYHHMLSREYQKDYRRVFQWLRLFFKRFPYVKPVQKSKAAEYLKIVYQLFGMELRVGGLTKGVPESHA